MERIIHTLYLKSLTNPFKEKRLVFDTPDAPDAPAEADGDDNKAAPEAEGVDNKVDTGGEGADTGTAEAEAKQADYNKDQYFGEFAPAGDWMTCNKGKIGALVARAKNANRTAGFQGAASGLIKGLETWFIKAVTDGIDAKEGAEFGKKFTTLSASMEVAELQDSLESTYANINEKTATALSAASNQTVLAPFDLENGIADKGLRDKVTAAVNANLSASQKGFIAAWAKIGKSVQEGKSLSKPSDLDALKKKIEAINALMTEDVATAETYMQLPEQDIVQEEQVRFLNAAIALSSKCESIGGQGKNAKNARKAQKANIDAALSELSKAKPDTAKVVALERSIEMAIVKGHLLDVMPGREAMIAKLFNVYASGEPSHFTSKESAAMAAFINEVNAVEGIKLRFEGGADAQKFDVDRKRADRDTYYSSMASAATRLLTDMPNNPYVRMNKALIEKVASECADPAKRDAFFAANKAELGKAQGALNTIIAFQRMNDPVGGVTGDAEKGLNLQSNNVQNGDKPPFYRYSLTVEWQAAHKDNPAADKQKEDEAAPAEPNGGQGGQEQPPAPVPPQGEEAPANDEDVPLPDVPGAAPADPNAAPDAPAADPAAAEADPNAPAPRAQGTLELKLATPTKKGEYVKFLGREYTQNGDKYYLKDNEHALSKDELEMLVGIRTVSEAYMNSKVGLSYIESEAKPTFDSAESTITIVYADPDDDAKTATVTYDIETGEREVAITDPAPELKFKDNSLATINSALKDGIPISNLEVKDEDPEKALKDAFVNGNYADALELLADQPKPNLDLVTRALELIADVDIAQIDSTKRAKLNTLLPEIAKNIWADQELADNYETLKALNNGKDLTGKALDALMTRKLSTDLIYTLFEVKENQANSTLQALYLKSGISDTDDLKEANLAAIKGFKGDISELSKEALAFVIANKEDFKKAAAKILGDYLASQSKKESLDDRDTFVSAYEEVYGADKVSPDVATWAAYAVSKNSGATIIELDIDKKVPDATKAAAYLTAWAKLKTEFIVPDPTDENYLRLKDLAVILSKVTDPNLIGLSQSLEAALAKFAKDNNKEGHEVAENLETKAKKLYEQVSKNNDLSYEERKNAISILLSAEFAGAKAGFDTHGALLEALAKVSAVSAYEAGDFKTLAANDDQVALLPQEYQKKFVEAWKTIEAEYLFEDEFNYLMENAAKIGAENLFKLSEKGMTTEHNYKLYLKLGLKEKAKAYLEGLADDKPEKHLLLAELEPQNRQSHLEKAYANITMPTVDAAGAITNSDDVTDYATQLRVIKGLEEEFKKQNPEAKLDFFQQFFDSEGKPVTELANLAITDDMPDDQKAAIVYARLIRANIEASECNVNSPKCDINELVTEAEAFMEANEGADLDWAAKVKEAVSKLKDSTGKVVGFKGLDAAAKEKYVALMLQAAVDAKEAKRPVDSYMEGIKEEDISDDNKVKYFELQGDYLKAAESETDADKIFELAQKAEGQKDVDKAKLAEVYNGLESKEAKLKAATLYLEIGKSAEAKAIMIDPAQMDQGDVKALITRFFEKHPDMGKEIAETRQLHSTALELYDKNDKFELSLDFVKEGLAASGNYKISKEQLINVLNKERTGIVRAADPSEAYEFYQELEVENLPMPERDNIKKNLGLTNEIITGIKEAARVEAARVEAARVEAARVAEEAKAAEKAAAVAKAKIDIKTVTPWGTTTDPNGYVYGRDAAGVRYARKFVKDSATDGSAEYECYAKIGDDFEDLGTIELKK